MLSGTITVSGQKRKGIIKRGHGNGVLLSVVITVKNEERHISDLLDSLVIQEPPFEIIIVDSNSTDRTRDIVRRYMEEHDNIYLYVKECTRGAGRNYGVEKSSGDYVVFIDGDEIANPFWLAAMRESIREGADVVAGKTIQIGYGPFEKLERVELFYRGMDITYPSCNLAYRKDLFLKIGGFDPWFITAEDIDLNLRAVEAGAKFAYNERAIVYHRTRDTVKAFLKQAFWNGYGRKQLTLKHGRLWGHYNPSRLLQSYNMSFWGLLRLSFAMMGYIYCKLKCRGYEVEG